MRIYNSKWPERAKEIIGKKYHRLTAIEFVGLKKSRPYFKFKCDCGKIIIRDIYDLTHRTTKSCGCLKHENDVRRLFKHGHGRIMNGAYRIWMGMNNRCNCKTNKHYKNYGGRGIEVCEKWSGHNGFSNFLSDMGERPSKNHTIERIDNNGNYETFNCKWALQCEQTRNRRTSVIIEINGESKCLIDWAKFYKIDKSTVANRRRKGWPWIRCFTSPLQHTGRNKKRISL